ncbi:hypothetical protein ACI78V_03460 [Geodermatophilus sp. SYSU D00742]
MSVTIAAQLDAIDALASELGALAAELGEDAQLCWSTAVSLGAAVGGDVGERAGATGSGWAALLELVAQQTGVLAATLSAAVDSYRLTDAGLADRLLVLRQGAASR